MTTAAEDAFAQLKEGNVRFVRGESQATYSGVDSGAAEGPPKPIAVIVGCSDSRVPIEIIFDAAMGDVWVIRSAGHVLSEAGLASVRFGVQEWGIPLVVVVGHDNCLAVQAAMTQDPPEWMAPIASFIATGLNERAEIVDPEDPVALEATVDEHVRASMAALRTYLNALPLSGARPSIVGGTYQVATGEVRWLD